MYANKIPAWVKLILLFGIEFDVRIYQIITLRKIVFAVLCFFLLKKINYKTWLYVPKSWIYMFISFFSLFLYVILLRKINIEAELNANTFMYPVNGPIIYLLYIIIFPSLLTLVFKNTEEFCVAQANIMFFQSIIILLGKLNQKFALFIYYRFNVDDGRMLDGLIRGVRLPGIDMQGSTASVILFSGCFCCLYGSSK